MDNSLARKIFKTAEEFNVCRRQAAAFRLKFGREMGPEDPFFFDPDADIPRFRGPHPTLAIDQIALLMSLSGVDPAAVYAFKKTGGLFPIRGSPMSIEEIDEWVAATNEYHANLLAATT